MRQDISTHGESFHPRENQLIHTKLDFKINFAVMYHRLTSGIFYENSTELFYENSTELDEVTLVPKRRVEETVTEI